MALTRRTLIGACAGAAAFRPAFAAPTPVRAVLELFTSQGCSSCPPADLLFMSLAREPGVLALSMPVTIWDHLGWKDTLAKTVFSERQKAYAHARGDRRIYTPQAVVNGFSHAVGSDMKAIEAAQRESALQNNILASTPELARSGSGWKIIAPSLNEARSMTGAIILVTFEREHSVEINRGENTGRTIRYGNVVRSLTRIAPLTETRTRHDLPAGLRSDDNQGFAILIQSGSDDRPGPMLGAIEAPRI